jgi:hypothetical protein
VFTRQELSVVFELKAANSAWYASRANTGERLAMMIEKVVSGGQTGVDRAALDAAVEAGIPVGGWCPKGRKAEDGVIPEGYPLEELDSCRYSSRTERNVVDSDGTLILNKGPLSEGTKATYDFTVQHRKPSFIIQLDAKEIVKPEQVRAWLQEQGIAVLNVAGPRESKCPEGIYHEAFGYLKRLFVYLRDL